MTFERLDMTALEKKDYENQPSFVGHQVRLRHG